MSFIILALASCLASALTLFSGFGLGTLLLPVMALFFPLDWAVAVTALVHFLNNVFKLSLFGKKADKKVVLFFGLPAFLAALAGAFVLNYLTRLPPVTTYVWMGKEHAITYFKLAISGLMIFFAMFEILPMFKNLSFSARWLPLGGVMSGFFGGLSGHQGAFRSAFLIRSGLSREAFIASGVVIACLVDVSRLSVYSTYFFNSALKSQGPLLITAVLSAFLGVILAKRVIHQITIEMIQRLIAILLIVIALGIGTGVI